MKLRHLSLVAACAVLASAVAMVVCPPVARSESLAAKRLEAERVAAEVAVLDARLDVAVARYARAAQDLAALEARIGDTSRELDSVRGQLGIAEQQLGMRAEALYKQGSTSLLDVLMSTGSFEELLSRAEYLRRVGRNDADIVAAVGDYRDRLADAQRRLETDRARAVRLAAARADEQARITTSLRARREMLAGIRAEVEALRSKAAARAAADTASVVTTPADSGDVGEGEGAWWPLIEKAAADNGISARGLYRLMMVESGGVATATNGPYRGLFQYAATTWRGDWNPWRGRDIVDGAAQIRATALAIRLGHGPGWWPNTYGWAFAS